MVHNQKEIANIVSIFIFLLQDERNEHKQDISSSVFVGAVVSITVVGII